MSEKVLQWGRWIGTVRHGGTRDIEVYAGDDAEPGPDGRRNRYLGRVVITDCNSDEDAAAIRTILKRWGS